MGLGCSLLTIYYAASLPAVCRCRLLVILVLSLSIVLSRKVDCDVGERVAKLKITLKLAVAPSPPNSLLKNVPVLSEAPWNKPVDRVLPALHNWQFRSRCLLTS